MLAVWIHRRNSDFLWMNSDTTVRRINIGQKEYESIISNSLLDLQISKIVTLNSLC